ncbi:hypothetical protein BS50DRAFT_288470 [Corynespora cassiicola Philippines]|uniref:Uncharacterized protein n=1 Tax=Corynespora cassiicola Philippines TaxID=1448308 RepID=A0A2T2N0U3_CORCC|nr:hypothetical protein BS50DRAFT_288470 [Corynespora cassiicola Philippines]
MKPSVACFAFASWFPVSCVVHVLIDSVLASKFSVARIAFIAWALMVECIYMLVDSVLALKSAITRVAFVFISYAELMCSN